ncbi:hypothetical protein E2C01_073302 [Portunus trituberculatus]|uniref:Uncharacterized protein n=1 Tax=Portunus trituberculatus TaxID=210409 RepID=A0A5B7IDM1_PORTR|nr:hypothetical protein [Portunus trituberculatus]
MLMRTLPCRDLRVRCVYEVRTR